MYLVAVLTLSVAAPYTYSQASYASIDCISVWLHHIFASSIGRYHRPLRTPTVSSVVGYGGGSKGKDIVATSSTEHGIYLSNADEKCLPGRQSRPFPSFGWPQVQNWRSMLNQGSWQLYYRCITFAVQNKGSGGRNLLNPL